MKLQQYNILTGTPSPRDPSGQSWEGNEEGRLKAKQRARANYDDAPVFMAFVVETEDTESDSFQELVENGRVIILPNVSALPEDAPARFVVSHTRKQAQRSTFYDGLMEHHGDEVVSFVDDAKAQREMNAALAKIAAKAAQLTEAQKEALRALL